MRTPVASENLTAIGVGDADRGRRIPVTLSHLRSPTGEVLLLCRSHAPWGRQGVDDRLATRDEQWILSRHALASRTATISWTERDLPEPVTQQSALDSRTGKQPERARQRAFDGGGHQDHVGGMDHEPIPRRPEGELQIDRNP